MVRSMKTPWLVLQVSLVVVAGCWHPAVEEGPPAPPDARGPAVAALVGSELAIVGVDGGVRGRYAFQPPAAPELGWTWLGESRGGLVTAVAGVEGPGRHRAQHRVVVGRDGRPRWDEALTGACQALSGQGPVLVGDEGSFASCNLGRPGWTFHRADGGLVELPDVEVLAAPLAGGLLPAVVGSGDAARCGFWKVETAELEPWPHPRCGAVTRLEASVVTLAQTPDGVLLVEESARGERVADGARPGPRARILEANAETGELLLGTFAPDTGRLEPTSLVVVDVALHAREVPLALEDLRSPFTVGADWPHLGAPGVLQLGQRDDFVGGLYESHDGRRWTRVGQGQTGVDGLASVSRGGTTVVVGARADDGRPETPFKPGHEQPLQGEAIQVISAADPSVVLAPARVNPARPVPLSRDGKWLAAWGERGLLVFDVEGGGLLAVPALTSADGSAALQWLE